jgi:heme/copper-type cytochrome/quinol oxidase subunit 1
MNQPESSIQKTGAVVSRAAGVVLLVLGLSAFASWSSFAEPSAISGWTSYSPLETNSPSTFVSQGAHSIVTVALLPCGLQALAGLVMILFSRGIGKWLAGGLSDDNSP